MKLHTIFAFAIAAATQANLPTPPARASTLTATDGAEYDFFGWSVSQSGANALVGAYQDDDKGENSGSAYYYQRLNTVDTETGTINQTVKLLATDGAASDQFGRTLSLSGDNALVGAYQHDANGKSNSGAAYYYQGLTGQTGTVTQTAKLVATDGAANDYFGDSVSLSGDNALVGAYQHDANGKNNSGSAYYYQGLTGQTGTVNQTVKLLASDGDTSDEFGCSVSLSGDNALVGAYGDDDKGSSSGSAYYFNGLNTVDPETGTVTQDVKLLATDGAMFGNFGNSVSLDGDRFVIGAYQATVNGVATGKAYAGDIRAFTTLDVGDGTALATDGLSFVSQTNWIIGATTANNTVTLTAGDTADITAPDAAVYIGQTAGADNNTLILEGALKTNDVHVGTDGATGNTLRLTTAALALLDLGTLYLDAGNYLEIEGANLDNDAVYTLLSLSGATVQVRGSEGGTWATLDGANATTLLANAGQVDGPDGIWTRFTTFDAPAAVPEPATWAALAGLALLTYALVVRRPRGNRL
jgi:hypothetical protein